MSNIISRLLLGIAITLVSLSSFASSVLCSKGPTSTITGTNNWTVIYSCTIPANTVATNQAIRLTASLYTGGTTGTDLAVFLNGVDITGLGFPQNKIAVFDLLIVNTGSTTGTLGGIFPSSVAPWIGPIWSPASGLDWASTQTLAIEFIFTSATATGKTFLVEVVN